MFDSLVQFHQAELLWIDRVSEVFSKTSKLSGCALEALLMDARVSEAGNSRVIILTWSRVFGVQQLDFPCEIAQRGKSAEERHFSKDVVLRSQLESEPIFALASPDVESRMVY